MPTASIDNFWLFLAIRAGLPAAFLMLLAFLWIYLAVSLKKGLEGRLVDYRTGFLISMTGFFFMGWTVALWDNAYVLFLFMMGSGVWMLDVESKDFDRLPQAWSTSGEGRCDDKHFPTRHSWPR
jgi:hypothetical protein